MSRANHWSKKLWILIVLGLLGVLSQDSVAQTQQDLYVMSRNQVQRFGPDGQFLGSFGRAANISGAVDLAIGPDGNIYVGNRGENRIDYFSPEGEYLGVFGQPSGTIQLLPRAMQFNDRGQLYVGSSLGGIHVFETDGTYTGILGETRNERPIRSIAFDNDGNIFASVPGTIQSGKSPPVVFGKVVVFDPMGVELGIFGETGDAGLLTPNDIAFGRDGNLYVAERGRVELFSSVGDHLGHYGETTNLGEWPGGGLTFDQHGNLYVAEFQRVFYYDENGRALGIYGDTDRAGFFDAVNLVFAPVPEPSSRFLGGAAVFALALFRQFARHLTTREDTRHHKLV